MVGHKLTTTNGPITLSTTFNFDQRLTVPGATTPVGGVVASVFADPLPTLDSDSTPGTSFLITYNVPQTADALQLTSATEAKFLLSGAVANWSIKDNYLVITDKVAKAATSKTALLGTVWSINVAGEALHLDALLAASWWCCMPMGRRVRSQCCRILTQSRRSKFL